MGWRKRSLRPTWTPTATRSSVFRWETCGSTFPHSAARRPASLQARSSTPSASRRPYPVCPRRATSSLPRSRRGSGPSRGSSTVTAPCAPPHSSTRPPRRSTQQLRPRAAQTPTCLGRARSREPSCSRRPGRQHQAFGSGPSNATIIRLKSAVAPVWGGSSGRLRLRGYGQFTDTGQRRSCFWSVARAPRVGSPGGYLPSDLVTLTRGLSALVFRRATVALPISVCPKGPMTVSAKTGGLKGGSMRHEFNYPTKAVMSVAIAILAFIVTMTAAVDAEPTSDGRKSRVTGMIGNFDIRVLDTAGLNSLLATHSIAATVQQSKLLRAQAIQGGLVQLRAAAPGADVSTSSVTGGVEVVKNDRGALTAPAPGRPGLEIVLEFLRTHPEVYGLTPADINQLHFIGESRSRATGIRMVRVEQRINGIAVFQSDTRFVLDPDGRLIRSVGLLVPDAGAGMPLATPGIGADAALMSAMKSVGIVLDQSRLQLEEGGTELRVSTRDARIRDGVRSELVYFPAAPGVLILAWSQVTFTRGPADWYTLVDAKTGTLLWRKNIKAHASTQEARFSVYVQPDGITPADSPAPQSPTPIASPGSGAQFPGIARTIVNMRSVQDTTASPNGWIPDGGTTTTGNNVDAYLDTNGNDIPDAGVLDNNGRPTGNPDSATRNRDFLGSAPRNFNFTPAPTGSNPDAGDSPTLSQSRRGAVTNAFYVANWYHDKLYHFGFDEAAGNFQFDNFGRGGVGGDRVLVELQDGADVNNASFSPPPDGQSGRMEMFIWNGPSPDRDAALDAEIMVHELTHGLSNRLIGNTAGLQWDVGGSLGEGWSDFYALALLNSSSTDDPNKRYAWAAYVSYKLDSLTDNYLYGARRFPYSTDMNANPLTWADVADTAISMAGGIAPSPLNQSRGGALELHNAGELWALSLWEVRSLIIAAAGGNVAAGNTTMLGIVTDAMKVTPINPSFIDARDALFAADCATNGCANEESIWRGFAKRGLGYKAVAPLGHAGVLGSGGHIGIGESFALPFLDVQQLIVNDSIADNNNVVDPGERFFLTVRLANP